MKQTLVWDIGVRIFHWALVSLILFQWLSSEIFDDWMEYHVIGGYCVLGLLVFRITWGFLGSKYSRFSAIFYRPSEVISYLTSMTDKDARAYAGHNPLGGIAVIVMLMLLLTQAVSGLFMTDDIFLEGPYYSTVSKDTLDLMSFLHNQIFDLILLLIAVHLVTVLYYQFYKKQLLINAMLHGYKKVPGYKSIEAGYLLRLIVIALLSGLLTYLLVEVFPPESIDVYDY